MTFASRSALLLILCLGLAGLPALVSGCSAAAKLADPLRKAMAPPTPTPFVFPTPFIPSTDYWKAIDRSLLANAMSPLANGLEQCNEVKRSLPYVTYNECMAVLVDKTVERLESAQQWPPVATSKRALLVKELRELGRLLKQPSVPFATLEAQSDKVGKAKADVQSALEDWQ